MPRRPLGRLPPGGRLSFHAEEHRYFLDGIELPSVTTILKEVGLIDSRFYTSAGRDRGSSVHEMLEDLDLFGDVDPLSDPELMGYAQAYKAFKEATGFKPEWIEKRVWHQNEAGEAYSGMLDRAGILNSRSALIDFKTGAPAEWHQVQLAAYSLAEGSAPAILAPLYLKENGRFDLRPMDAAEKMNAARTWEWALRKYWEAEEC